MKPSNGVLDNLQNSKAKAVYFIYSGEHEIKEATIEDANENCTDLRILVVAHRSKKDAIHQVSIRTKAVFMKGCNKAR